MKYNYSCFLLKFILITIFISFTHCSYSAFFNNLYFQRHVILNDTLNKNDTLNASNLHDTTAKKTEKVLEAKVEYRAKDSIVLNMKSKLLQMYKEGEVKYEKITQKAGYIEYSFENNILTALPIYDSLNKPIEIPEFSEKDQSFKSNLIKYNFKTKEGIIRNVITHEGEGYLHGDFVKKKANDVNNLKGGGYTTCNLEHPHFGLFFLKAKVIPGDKIVTGPVYMMIEDVPLPIVLPFGFFPNKKGQASGVLIPTYGEQTVRGFFLEKGGYYFGISDYFDFTLVGDIYSNGSWALHPSFNYKKRYKYDGAVSITYAANLSGVKGSPSYNKINDFNVKWRHSQDSKANPNSRFSANVNFGSSTFNKHNPMSMQEHLSTQFSSGVNYYTKLFDIFNFNASLNHSQNNRTKTVSLSLPTLSLSANTFYPFRKKDKISSIKWYENISVGYRMDLKNEINTYDSLFFTKKMFNDFQSGVKHSIPISQSSKVLKYFQWTNSVNINEYWYPKYIDKKWINNDTVIGSVEQEGFVKTDVIRKFKSAHDIIFSSSLSTTLYGIKQFKKGFLKAIRHVVSPTVSFNYRPDLNLGYYKNIVNVMNGKKVVERYSIFNDQQNNVRAIYGAPNDGKSGSIRIGLSNRLDIKVASKADTITGTKKITLIENLNIGAGYDLMRDSIRWSPLAMSGSTTIFNNFRVSFSAQWNPYVKDTNNRFLNKYEWQVNRKLLRYDNSSIDINFSYSLNPQTFKKQNSDEKSSNKRYIDWDNTWSLSFDYFFKYSNVNFYPKSGSKNEVMQSVSANGNIKITEKWFFNFRFDYDIQENQLTNSSFSISRDLHCWEMVFNWVPMGYLKGWDFTIRAKASMLQDLKYNKKKDFRDNM